MENTSQTEHVGADGRTYYQTHCDKNDKPRSKVYYGHHAEMFYYDPEMGARNRKLAACMSGAAFNPEPMQVTADGKYDPNVDYQKQRTATEELQHRERKAAEKQRAMDRWQDERASDGIKDKMLDEEVPGKALKDIAVFCPMEPTSRQTEYSYSHLVETEVWHGECRNGQRFTLELKFTHNPTSLKRFCVEFNRTYENVLMV